MIATEIKIASIKFNRWFPIIAPILNVGYKKQDDHGDINFKYQTTSESGL